MKGVNTLIAACSISMLMAFSPSGKMKTFIDSEQQMPLAMFTCNTDYIYSFIYKFRSEIDKIADDNNVSPLLIAATIMNENECRPKYEDWKDSIGVLLGMNPSVGVGQVRISTAIELYKKYMHKTLSKRTAIRLLNNPQWSIRFIAMYYRREMEKCGLDRSALKSPNVMKDLIARYVGGNKYKTKDAQIQGYNGILQIADVRLWRALDKEVDWEMISKIRDFTSKKRATFIKRLKKRL